MIGSDSIAIFVHSEQLGRDFWHSVEWIEKAYLFWIKWVALISNLQISSKWTVKLTGFFEDSIRYELLNHLLNQVKNNLREKRIKNLIDFCKARISIYWLQVNYDNLDLEKKCMGKNAKE